MITLLLHMLRLLPFLCGGHCHLALENLALRQQLAAYKRMVTRPKLRMTDRLFWVALASVWAGGRVGEPGEVENEVQHAVVHAGRFRQQRGQIDPHVPADVWLMSVALECVRLLQTLLRSCGSWRADATRSTRRGSPCALGRAGRRRGWLVVLASRA